jgi:hypothetical protein
MIVYSYFGTTSPVGNVAPSVSAVGGVTSYTVLTPGTATGRGAVQIPDGLAPGFAYPPLQPGDDPTTFGAYQNAMRAAVGLYTDAVAAAGFAYTGTDALDGVTQRTFQVPLTDSLNLNVTQIAVGLSLGIMSFPQSIGPDASGHALLIPDAATWAAFLAAYHPARIRVDGGPGTGGGGEYLARIAAATTAAQLDAIRFG